MKASHIIAYSVLALLVAVSGCGKNDVAALDKAGDEDLASPNKAEARQWLSAPSHVVFRGEKQAVIKFVDEFYAAGVVMVYVTGIEKLGGTEVTETLLLVLPKDSAVRARVFEVANRAKQAFQNNPDKDVGQKYLSFVLD